MGRRGVQAQIRRRSELARRAEQPALAPPLTDGLPAQVRARLQRTRGHLDKLRDKLDAELAKKEAPDWRALKAIADAIATLEDVERVLDGRPLPGALRPTGRQAPTLPGVFSEPALA
jgi:hypothetical protein